LVCLKKTFLAIPTLTLVLFQGNQLRIDRRRAGQDEAWMEGGFVGKLVWKDVKDGAYLKGGIYFNGGTVP
jgi:hypothetical protein